MVALDLSIERPNQFDRGFTQGGVEKMTSRIVKLMAAAGVAGFAGWAGQASAVELVTPYLPGNSVGIPTGALPPPGFYASDVNVVIEGPIFNNSGNAIPANVNVYLNIPSVLWVPGLNILGATYAAAIVEPYVQQNLDLTGLGAGKETSQGMFNTIIVPIVLSWNMHPFFISTGLGIYANDGYTVQQTVGGAHILGAGDIANDYWTFEPDVAVSWLQSGWNLTAKAVVDANTKDTWTNYQSGDVFYLDFTASYAWGKWTFGAGGNWTQQFTNDTVAGTSVPTGHKVERVLLGPLIGYNFGPAELNAKYLKSVSSENIGASDFTYFGVSFPF